MSKNIIVLTAEVKYPASDHTYLTCNSYVVESGLPKPLSDAIDDFKANIKDEIVNFVAYVVPAAQLEEALTGVNAKV